jgi:predicted membrane metal-binding protein
MASRTDDKFKCPACGSTRTKPVSVAISSGTRRRTTVGVSRRSAWWSSSTYKTDLVASLPDRPSNGGAYLLIFLGVCGLLFAFFIGANEKDLGTFVIVVGVVSALLVWGGIAARKPADQSGQRSIQLGQPVAVCSLRPSVASLSNDADRFTIARRTSMTRTTI